MHPYQAMAEPERLEYDAAYKKVVGLVDLVAIGETLDEVFEQLHRSLGSGVPQSVYEALSRLDPVQVVKHPDYKLAHFIVNDVVLTHPGQFPDAERLLAEADKILLA